MWTSWTSPFNEDSTLFGAQWKFWFPPSLWHTTISTRYLAPEESSRINVNIVDKSFTAPQTSATLNELTFLWISTLNGVTLCGPGEGRMGWESEIIWSHGSVWGMWKDFKDLWKHETSYSDKTCVLEVWGVWKETKSLKTDATSQDGSSLYRSI